MAQAPQDLSRLRTEDEFVRVLMTLYSSPLWRQTTRLSHLQNPTCVPRVYRDDEIRPSLI